MSERPQFLGMESHEELDPHKQIRPSKSLLRELLDLLGDPLFLGGTLVFLGMTMFIVPAIVNILLLLGIAVLVANRRKAVRQHLPLRMPAYSKRTDYGSPKPGRKGFDKAKGIFFLGTSLDLATLGQQLWLAGRDLLTHLLVLGTTGAGKTETLLSLSFNFLTMGSGFFYVDPKASIKLYGQVGYMARVMAAEDDLRVVNFMQGKRFGERTPFRTTNTLNPFAGGGAEDVTQLMNSLIEVSHDGNAVFGQNAMSTMNSLSYLLCEMRDLGDLQLSISTIRDYMTADKIIEMMQDPRISKQAYRSAMALMTSFGYRHGAQKQADTMYTQFGYARAYFNMAISSIADQYGNIFNVPRGEVSMTDVVINRRIFVGLLPALKKAPEEVRNLGKIILAQVRLAAGVGLGDKVEGTWEDVVKSLPTEARSPFGAITDEYAAIALKGYVMMATQARGLGICALVGSQDFAGIRSADADEAEQLVANMKTKIFMAQEDPNATWELVKTLAGEARTFLTSGSHIDTQNTLGIDYKDQLQSQLSTMERVNLRDLQRQLEGEFHLFTRGEMIRGEMFYANPEPPDKFQMMITQLVPVDPPNRTDLDIRLGKTREIITEMKRRIESGEAPGEEETPAFIEPMLAIFDATDKRSKEVGVAAFMNSLLTGGSGGAGRLKKMKAIIAGDAAPDTVEPVVDAETTQDDADPLSPPPLDEKPPVEEESVRSDSAPKGGDETEPPKPESRVSVGDGMDFAPPDLLGGADSPTDGEENSSPEEPEEAKGSGSEETDEADDPVAGSGGGAIANRLSRFTESVIDKDLEDDLVAFEQGAGASEEQSRRHAKRTIEHAREQLDYPRPPVPEALDEGDRAQQQDALSESLRRIMRDAQSRT